MMGITYKLLTFFVIRPNVVEWFAFMSKLHFLSGCSHYNDYAALYFQYNTVFSHSSFSWVPSSTFSFAVYSTSAWQECAVPVMNLSLHYYKFNTFHSSSFFCPLSLWTHNGLNSVTLIPSTLLRPPCVIVCIKTWEATFLENSLHTPLMSAG